MSKWGAWAAALSTTTAVGCAAVLGIDKDYHPLGGGGGGGAEDSSSGGGSTPGSGGSAPGGGGSASSCPNGHLAFTDDFGDGVLDSRWGKEGGAGASVDEKYETLQMSLGNAGEYWADVYTNSTVDLTNCSAFVEVSQVPTFVRVVYLIAYADTMNKVELYINTSDNTAAPVLGADMIIDSVYVYKEEIPFDSTKHRWLRLRESQGAFYYDFSANGTSWETFASTQTQLDVAALHITLGAESYNEGDQAQFDNFNVSP